MLRKKPGRVQRPRAEAWYSVFPATGAVGGVTVGSGRTFPDAIWRGNASYSGWVCTRNNRQPETKYVGSWEAAILKRAAFQGK